MDQHREPHTCVYHRREAGAATTIPDALLPMGETRGEQVARLTALVSACEHDGYALRNHSHDVMTLSTRLAMHCGFDPSQLRAIRTGAFLHDIGKIFTALPVLLSNKRGLDEAEWREMMRHPEDGASLVTHPDLATVRGLVGCHHEWPGNPGPLGRGVAYPASLTDEERAACAVGGHTVAGRSGYPRRIGRALLSDEILLLSVADWYAGCAERRLYRAAQPHEVAMQWTEEAAAAGKIDPHFTTELGRMLAHAPWHPCSDAVGATLSVTP